jgi:hypothetical protein
MANDNGGAGGIKNGVGVRRADKWQNSDSPSLGWIPNTPPNPQGGPGVKFGPGSKLWDSRNRAKTTGQAGGGKPKR